jgi:hypothetical protein
MRLESFGRDAPIPASEREIRTPLVVNAFPILSQGSLHLRNSQLQRFHFVAKRFKQQ